MIVVDTNIISYLLLPTPYTESVEALYLLESDWSAPVLWKSEFRNVLAMYMRKNIITFEQALQIQEQAESILSQQEFDCSSLPVLSLVNSSQCSAYDCEFVALAQHLNTSLLTQDKKILSAFPDTAIAVKDYLALK